MSYAIRTDPDYIAIEKELEHRNGLLLDAWLMDGSEKRFPALVTGDALGKAHRRYTRMINFREGWKGHLWQERFHSFVMDE